MSVTNNSHNAVFFVPATIGIRTSKKETAMFTRIFSLKETFLRCFALTGAWMLSLQTASAEIKFDQSKIDELPLSKRLVDTTVDIVFTWGGLSLLAVGLFVFVKSLVDKENRTINFKALVGAILGAGMAAIAGEIQALLTK